MKLILLVVSLFLSINSFAQLKLDYYIQAGYKIIDIRNSKIVCDNFPQNSIVKVEDDHIKVVAQNYGKYTIQKYSKSFKLIWTQNFTGQLSPNWSFYFSVENGDLQKTSIDWELGQFGTKEQFTELGTFRRSTPEYQLWTDKYFFFHYNSKVYRLDVNTKEIIETPLPHLFGKFRNTLSPLSDYILAWGKIYSINENKVLNDRSEYFMNIVNNYSVEDVKPSEDNATTYFIRWVGNTEYLVCHVFNSGKKTIAKYSVNDIYNPISEITLEDLNFKMVNTERGLIGTDNTYYSEILKENTLKQTSDDYFLVTKDNGFQKARSLYILDTNNGTFNLLTESVTASGAYNAIADRIDTKHYLYSSSRDILKQGTYIYNISTQEKTKILKYPATKIWNLRNTELVIFIANNEVYKFNKDTKQVEPLKLPITRIFDMITVSNFSPFNKVR